MKLEINIYFSRENDKKIGFAEVTKSVRNEGLNSFAKFHDLFAGSC